MDREPLAPPSAALIALEARAGAEFASFLAALPILEIAPRGDGHPVLVLPGWMAGDYSTRPLRWVLRRRGYHVHGWRLGRNLGPAPETIRRIGERFHHLRQRHGRRVSLVGWSLGGIYARELARAFPGDVRQVITLGSPFRDPLATNAARFFDRREYEGRRRGDREAERRRIERPIPVPATAIYSKTDGVCAWRSCLEEEGPLAQNVEVFASHIGLGHHPAALWVIADRLAQAEGVWQPFAPTLPCRWAFGALSPATA